MKLPLPDTCFPAQLKSHEKMQVHARHEGQVDILVKRERPLVAAAVTGPLSAEREELEAGAAGDESVAAAECEGAECEGAGGARQSVTTSIAGPSLLLGDAAAVPEATPACQTDKRLPAPPAPPAPGVATIGSGEGCTMSCSDKIAVWNAVGAQGALLSLFCDPIRFDTCTVGRKFSRKFCERALCCRLQDFTPGKLPALSACGCTGIAHMAMLGCAVKLDEADDYYTPDTLRANFEDPTCVCWCKGDEDEHGGFAEVMDGRTGAVVTAAVAALHAVVQPLGADSEGSCGGSCGGGGVEDTAAPAPLGAPSRFSKAAMLGLCSAALAASGASTHAADHSFADYRLLKDKAVSYQCAKDVLFSPKTPFQHWLRSK